MTSLADRHRHAEHDRHRRGAGRAAHLVHLQILPAGLHRVRASSPSPWWRKPIARPSILPEAESELVAGFHTEYSGFRWSLFFLAEYAAMLAVSSIAVTLWLGGWMRPFPNWLSGSAWDMAFSLRPGADVFRAGRAVLPGHGAHAEDPADARFRRSVWASSERCLASSAWCCWFPAVRERVQDIFWFVAKVAFFMYLYIWYRGTFPRYRFDQLMKVGWKVLLPIGLGVLIATAICGPLPGTVAALSGGDCDESDAAAAQDFPG